MRTTVLNSHVQVHNQGRLLEPVLAVIGQVAGYTLAHSSRRSQPSSQYSYLSKNYSLHHEDLFQRDYVVLSIVIQMQGEGNNAD